MTKENSVLLELIELGETCAALVVAADIAKGLDLVQLRVLWSLKRLSLGADSDGGVQVGAISRELLMQRSAVSREVAALVKAGLAKAVDSNVRTSGYKLTPPGLSLTKELLSHARALDRLVYDLLPRRDPKRLLTQLTDIRRSLPVSPEEKDSIH